MWLQNLLSQLEERGISWDIKKTMIIRYNAYIQIVSPKALISDARARNRTFIEMIKGQAIRDNNTA